VCGLAEIADAPRLIEAGQVEGRLVLILTLPPGGLDD
jgi:hypothetical protein